MSEINNIPILKRDHTISNEGWFSKNKKIKEKVKENDMLDFYDFIEIYENSSILNNIIELYKEDALSNIKTIKNRIIDYNSKFWKPTHNLKLIDNKKPKAGHDINDKIELFNNKKLSDVSKELIKKIQYINKQDSKNYRGVNIDYRYLIYGSDLMGEDLSIMLIRIIKSDHYIVNYKLLVGNISQKLTDGRDPVSAYELHNNKHDYEIDHLSLSNTPVIIDSIKSESNTTILEDVHKQYDDVDKKITKKDKSILSSLSDEIIEQNNINYYDEYSAVDDDRNPGELSQYLFNIVWDTEYQLARGNADVIELHNILEISSEHYDNVMCDKLFTSDRLSTEDYKKHNEMKLNPYDTSFGSILPIPDLKTELLKYLAISDNNLNYEYRNSDDCSLVIITGKNEDEKNLPLWDHPYVFENTKNETIVALDVRKYVNKTNDELMNIQDIVRDKSGFGFNIMRALLTCDFISKQTGNLHNIVKTCNNVYGIWISSVLTSVLSLNSIETLYLEIGAIHCSNMLSVDKVSREEVIKSIAKISNSKLSNATGKNTVRETVEKLENNIPSLEAVVQNLKKTLPDYKQELLDVNVFVNSMSGSWYSPSGVQTVFIGLESLPTLIAMIYSAGSDKTYKRTRLAMILDKYKSKLKLVDFNKQCKRYLDDKTL